MKKNTKKQKTNTQKQLDTNVTDQARILALNDDELLEIGSRLGARDLGRLSVSCERLYGLFQPRLETLKTQALMLAVIDDDSNTVNRILKDNPDLLLKSQKELENHCPNGIESQLTWQRFRPEPPLAIALKRNQVRMVETLLPYYKQCSGYNAEQMKLLWESAEAARKDQIQKSELFSFLPVLKAILFGESLESHADVDKFREFLLPKKMIELDDYFDIVSLLLSACNIYYKCYNNLYANQRDQFCITVIGLLQSLLPPEDASILCTGVVNFSGLDKELTSPAAQYRLQDGTSCYRTSPLDKAGMGFKYFATAEGYAARLTASENVPMVFLFQGYAQPLRLIDLLRQSLFEQLCDLNSLILLEPNTPASPFVGGLMHTVYRHKEERMNRLKQDILSENDQALPSLS